MKDPFYKRLNPLETRPYRVRGYYKQFFCPLCRSERYIKTIPYLDFRNYMQIFITSVVLIIVTYPLFAEKSFFWPILVWVGMEFAKRARYRKEIPCNYCGFDAAWYKKDVKVARRLALEFWEKKQAASLSLEELSGDEAEPISPPPAQSDGEVSEMQL